MTTKCRSICAIAIVACLTSAAGAQNPPRPATPARPGAPEPQVAPAPPLPREPPPPPGEVQPARERPPAERPFVGRPINIKLQLDIIDEGGPQPARKSVTLTVADRQSAFVRAEVFVPDIGPVPLSIDALPTLDNDGKVRARISLDYRPNPGTDRKQPMPTTIRLSFGIILENGKMVQASQAADPVTDRRVSVQITATW